MQLFAIGLNHQTAPLNVREQVVFHAERLVGAFAPRFIVTPKRRTLRSNGWRIITSSSRRRSNRISTHCRRRAR